MIDQLGKYRILNKLGQGGFGDVYLAEDTMLGNQVALKVLAAHYLRNPTVVKRFRHEARAAARLHHPNIVRIHDLGEAEGVIYLAMEYLPGRSLAQLIADEGPLPLARAAGLVGQIASALDYAHGQGLIHRDVKPSNVVVDDQDHATLTDFGLVKAAEGTEFSVLEIADGSEQFTSGGSLIGTPEYMAPEQAEPGLGPVDGRTDLYALGVIAYQMLTGRLPFKADTPVATLRAQVDLEPPAPGQWADLPEEASAALLRALAKKPADRWQRAGDFAEALAEAARRQEAIHTGEQEVTALYAQAQAAVEHRDWTRALALCGQVMDRRPDYEQVDALFMKANEGLARQKQWEAQQGELAALYDQAEQQEKAGELEAAIVTLQQIITISGDYTYRDTPQRLAKAANARERAEVQRQARIEVLRGQAMDLVSDLLACMEGLSALLPGDSNLARQRQLVEALRARFAGEPVREEEGLVAKEPTRTEQGMLSEPAWPHRKKPWLLWAAAGLIALLTIALIAVVATRPTPTKMAGTVVALLTQTAERWTATPTSAPSVTLVPTLLPSDTPTPTPTPTRTDIPTLTPTLAPTNTPRPPAQIRKTVVVPATTANGINTEWRVEPGDVLMFQAGGSWCWGGTGCSGPDGVPGRPGADEHPTTLEGEPFCKLIGRVDDWLFPIGSSAVVTMTTGGELLLLMNDRMNYYYDNSGSITVTLTITMPAVP